MKRFFFCAILLCSTAVYSFWEGMAFRFFATDRDQAKCRNAQEFLRAMGIRPPESCEEMENKAFWRDGQEREFMSCPRQRFQAAVEGMMTQDAENRYRSIVERNLKSGILERHQGMCKEKIEGWQRMGLFPGVDSVMLCSAMAHAAQDELFGILRDPSLTLLAKYEEIGFGLGIEYDFSCRTNEAIQAERRKHQAGSYSEE